MVIGQDFVFVDEQENEREREEKESSMHRFQNSATVEGEKELI